MKSTRPKRWQLQDAKAKFSEVFERAVTEGPQYVTRRSKDEVVVLSRKEYDRLKGEHDRPSLIEALLACPKVSEFKIHRDPNDVVGREPPLFGEET